MYITGLVAKNCYSFDEITISFDEEPIIQVIGNNLDEKRISKEDSGEFYSNANGVGKTNLYNLIIQALYSRDIYKTKKAFLSNLYSKEKFNILLYLVINEEIYRVKYNNNECLLYKNNKLYLEGRQKITDFFEELVPFELFLRLTYLSPKIYFPFFESTNKEQQEFLSLIFKDLLTLKKKLPKIKEERQHLQKQIVELEKELHHLEQQKSQKYKEEKELPKKPIILDHSKEISELSQEQGKITQQLTKLKELTYELSEIHLNLLDINYDEQRYLALYSEGKTLKNKIQKTEQLISRISELKEKSYCPTCLQKVDQATTNKHLHQLKKDLQTFNSDLELCRSEYSALQEIKKQKEEEDKKSQRKNQLILEIAKYNKDYLIDRLHTIELNLKELQVQQQIENKKLNEYNEKLVEIEKFNEQQRVIKSQIQWANKQLNIVKHELTEAKQSVQILLTLEEVCNKVIVAKQIPNRLKILESFINEELANYTSQYSVKLSMKNDKIIKEITKEGKTYPIENLSSGEKTRLNIALLFAVRHILLALQKDIYNINLVFFDEVFGTLDVSGRNILVETIKEYGLNQFIVSHSYINPEYPVLELVRKNNKTRIKE